MAYRALWGTCKEDFDQCGIVYHARRGSEKRLLVDALFSDIITAFDKLDSVQKIPPIFCEATDLIKIPSLEVDPVSKRLEENSSSLNSGSSDY